MVPLSTIVRVEMAIGKSRVNRVPLERNPAKCSEPAHAIKPRYSMLAFTDPANPVRDVSRVKLNGRTSVLAVVVEDASSAPSTSSEALEGVSTVEMLSPTGETGTNLTDTEVATGVMAMTSPGTGGVNVTPTDMAILYATLDNVKSISRAAFPEAVGGGAGVNNGKDSPTKKRTETKK
jgi:hypothetical protein